MSDMFPLDAYFGCTRYDNVSQKVNSSTYGDDCDGSIFGSADYSSPYGDIIDSLDQQIEDIQSARAKQEADAAAKKKAEEEAAAANGESSGTTPGADGTNGSNGTNGTPGTDGADGTAGTDGADGAAGTEGADGTDGTEGANETDGTGEPEAATEYSDDELVLIHSTVEDILDATVRFCTGPFKLGTDEVGFIKTLSNPEVTPKVLKGVQAELKEQGYDLFELIRGETSGGDEDVLEGYALAKLGGTSKESKTKLESYEKYADMDKDSVEYRNYVRTCVSLFKEAVNGWGTDEKVLCYILSLPDDILSDIKASYGDGFDERAKGEVSGRIKSHFFE